MIHSTDSLSRERTQVLRPSAKDSAPNSFFSRLPNFVFVVAVLAVILHMAPYWRADVQAPPGWRFTGNLNSLADFMQYRVWFRQSQQAGPVVMDKFTTEPNQPHIPVFFYYAVGATARWMHRSPEAVYQYSGSLFAFLFIILLFATVRHFSKSPGHVRWVFFAILIGGGLGAYIKFLARFPLVHQNTFARRLILEPLSFAPLFEDYRDHYVFLTLFDTHFLLIWSVATAAVLSFYFTLREFSWWRVGLTSLLYAVMTLLHIYEGVLLIMVAVSVGWLFWRKGLLDRRRLLAIAVCLLPAILGILWVAYLSRVSGLPVPSWRAPDVIFSFLVISYPLAWVLIAGGLADYWRSAGINECFLLGWTLGCLILALSGPFNPYSPRGTMTLQIPLYLIAGAIYYSRHAKIMPTAAFIAILLLGATPAWALARYWTLTRFEPHATYMFAGVEHDAIVDVLKQRASSNDVLLAAEPDLLWLGPEYPGLFYCAHPVWTVDYKLKQERLAQFFASNPAEQSAFLQKERIRFLYADARQDTAKLQQIPGLVLLKAAPPGSLFEYGLQTSDGPQPLSLP